jgi:hypothetical protein
MNVRGELLKSIKDIGAISTSLKDITDAYKAVNESIRMFSAAIPVGQLESKDDMWQTSQRLIDYRKELEAKETELRKKRLRNIDITPT